MINNNNMELEMGMSTFNSYTPENKRMDTPKSWVLEKVTPALNMAILGIHLGCFCVPFTVDKVHHWSLPRPETGLESPSLSPTPKT